MEDIKELIKKNKRLLYMPSVLEEKSFSIDMYNGLVVFYGTGEMFMSMELWEKTREDLICMHCDLLEGITFFNDVFDSIKANFKEYYDRHIEEFKSKRDYVDTITNDTRERFEKLIEVLDKASTVDVPSLEYIKELFSSLSVEQMFSDVFIMKIYERLKKGELVYLNGSHMLTFCHDIISVMNLYYADDMFLRIEDELLSVIEELKRLG